MNGNDSGQAVASRALFSKKQDNKNWTRSTRCVRKGHCLFWSDGAAGGVFSIFTFTFCSVKDFAQNDHPTGVLEPLKVPSKFLTFVLSTRE